MHFNRIVTAVVGDRTELRICFHFVWSLDSFSPTRFQKNKTKKKANNSVYIPEMPERFGRVPYGCPYLDALCCYRKRIVVGFFSPPFPHHVSLQAVGRRPVQRFVISTSLTNPRATLMHSETINISLFFCWLNNSQGAESSCVEQLLLTRGGFQCLHFPAHLSWLPRAAQPRSAVAVGLGASDWGAVLPSAPVAPSVCFPLNSIAAEPRFGDVGGAVLLYFSF